MSTPGVAGGAPLDKAIDIGAIVGARGNFTANYRMVAGIAEAATSGNRKCSGQRAGCITNATLLSNVLRLRSWRSRRFWPVAGRDDLSNRRARPCSWRTYIFFWGCGSVVERKLTCWPWHVSAQLKAGVLWVTARSF